MAPTLAQREEYRLQQQAQQHQEEVDALTAAIRAMKGQPQVAQLGRVLGGAKKTLTDSRRALREATYDRQWDEEAVGPFFKALRDWAKGIQKRPLTHADTTFVSGMAKLGDKIDKAYKSKGKSAPGPLGAQVSRLVASLQQARTPKWQPAPFYPMGAERQAAAERVWAQGLNAALRDLSKPSYQTAEIAGITSYQLQCCARAYGALMGGVPAKIQELVNFLSRAHINLPPFDRAWMKIMEAQEEGAYKRNEGMAKAWREEKDLRKATVAVDGRQPRVSARL